jgi:cbb3-type cytochrome oxidase cytochrome c subunit
MLTTAFGRRLIKLGPWREDNTTEMDAIIANMQVLGTMVKLDDNQVYR